MSEFSHAVKIFGLSLLVFEIFDKECGHLGKNGQIFTPKNVVFMLFHYKTSVLGLLNLIFVNL